MTRRRRQNKDEREKKSRVLVEFVLIIEYYTVLLFVLSIHTFSAEVRVILFLSLLTRSRLSLIHSFVTTQTQLFFPLTLLWRVRH